MSAPPRTPPLDADPRDVGANATPTPGQLPIVLAGLSVGVLLMGVQLWLLTVALDLYLGGQGGRVWLLALVSGLIFAGGLVVLWVLRRRPRRAGA